MNTQLLNDTFRLLDELKSPVAGIALDICPESLQELASVLESSPLSPRRRSVLLTLYALLVMARERHRDCSYQDTDLTRRILDGDYLYSLYLQSAVQFRETGLAAYIAPVLKRQHIAFAEGRPAEENLALHFETYLSGEHKPKQTIQAM